MRDRRNQLLRSLAGNTPTETDFVRSDAIEIGFTRNGPPETDSDDERQTMNRRRWLTYCGVATVPAVAGCLGDDDDTDDSDDDPDDDDTDDTDDTGDPDDTDEQAQEAYDDALDELVAVAETLDELSRDGTDPEQATVDELGGRLDTAESLLDDASNENPSGDLAEQIAAAQSVAAFQRELTEYNALVVEYNAAFESGFGYWNEDAYDSAAGAFLDAHGTVEAILSHLDDVADAHTALDSGVLDEPALEYSGEYWEYIGVDSVEEAEAIGNFTIGLNEFLTGLDVVVSGEDAYEQERFGDASDLFEAAHQEMTAARDSFALVVDEPALDEESQNEVAGYLALADPWAEATEKFKEAADLADEGDIEAANERYDDGVALLPD